MGVISVLCGGLGILLGLGSLPLGYSAHPNQNQFEQEKRLPDGRGREEEAGERSLDAGESQ